MSEMPTKRIPCLLFLFLAAAFWRAGTLCAQDAQPQLDQPLDEAGRLAFFRAQVKPLLKKRCQTCHSGEKPKGALHLTSRAGVLRGGDTGPAVSLEKPDESLLLEAINYAGYEMPPKGKLPQAEIDVLTRWVRLGVPWDPEDQRTEPAAPPRKGPPQVTEETKRFWSFQPVVRPEPPPVERGSWVTNPIDAFILARLEAAGLAPNPPASRAALIRRACYNLTGLPPEPEDVAAFVADDSPGAWERLIDRLLDSPQYGEKWGRHWLDLVRFAETNSYERDGHKANAWRYRDYVIASLNDDKPYDRFLTEQLAGDELEPPTPEGLVATGYYRLGIWDDEPSDVKLALYDDLDDIATTTCQVMLGLTINCARCHDHKLDPLPQRDYYRFLSFFAGVHRLGGPPHGREGNMFGGRDVDTYSQRPIGTPDQKRQQAEAVAAHQAEVKQVQAEIAAIESTLRKVLSNPEKEDFRSEQNRLPIAKQHVGEDFAQEQFDRYAALKKKAEQLKRFRPPALEMALCVTEVGATPRKMHVLVRGNPHVEGDEVQPGFPEVLSPPEPEIVTPKSGATSGRRLALARWIASPENPLTARVIVNRVWAYHFGRGIVRSVSNFGLQGTPPTHPQLLDWLASELVRRGWSLKALHKLIMTSSAYRMSSRGSAPALSKDPENDLLWRFDMRRLSAEEVRDSILAVNGSLNLKAGGPSIYPVIPPEVLAGQSRPGAGWGNSSPEERRRRSVYIYVKRSLMTPIIASFDGPETDFSCPERFATTQPTQALGMLNSAFINDQARVFAAYLRAQAGDAPAAQVRLGLRRAMQHEPTDAQVRRGVALIEALQNEDDLSAEAALDSFCLVALNLNEFLYLD